MDVLQKAELNAATLTRQKRGADFQYLTVADRGIVTALMDEIDELRREQVALRRRLDALERTGG